MSVVKRGKRYHLKFAPFLRKEVMVVTEATTKTQAKDIERAIKVACRSGVYTALDPLARGTCIQMFQNQGWNLPEGLIPEPIAPKQELNLWRAAEVFLNYPTVVEAKCRERYRICLGHLVDHFGKGFPIKDVWVPQLRRYQVERRAKGAAAATVNWELATLSRLFCVLIELQYVVDNPCRLVRKQSTKGTERQVYLSLEDVRLITAQCPAWFRPAIWTSYFTGMRRGEVLHLTRCSVDLPNRMIHLGAGDTKEGRRKRIPIHRELGPILEAAMKVSILGCDLVFLVRDRKGVRPVSVEGAKNPWPRAMDALKWPEPRPVFHDLRGTWRANARRSGVDPQIAERILGHWDRELSVNERYGAVSNQELLAAIDKMTFDNGCTENLGVPARR
jgi:integrase